MITVLHLSDLHYRSNDPEKTSRIFEQLKATLNNEKVDLVIFSGDLVCAGENSYQEAMNKLFIPLLKDLGLDISNFFIVPGNHDLDRKDELPMVANSLKDVDSVEKVDDFCNVPEQLSFSINRFKEYNTFVRNLYKDCPNVECNDLYYTMHWRNIGIIGLNSAWRSIKSDTDRGNLIFPISHAEKAINTIKDTNFRICVMHHNTSDFKEDIGTALEDLIFDQCHFLFTGHYHKYATSSHCTSKVGLIHSVSPAMYNKNDKISKYGFALWNIDETTFEATERIYMFEDNVFTPLSPRCLTIPMDEKKKKENELRKLIKIRLDETKSIADKSFVSGTQSATGKTFHTLFKKPIIKDKSVEECIATRKPGNYVSIEDIIKRQESIFLVGSNKSGKTAILRKIQLDTLSSSLEDNVLPLFIEYKKYKAQNFDIKSILRTYLHFNKKDTDSFLESHQILLLIDDMDINDSRFIRRLESVANNLPKVKVIICSEGYLISPQIAMSIKGKNLTSLYIHSITEEEIHELTVSWPNIAQNVKIEAEERIVRLCKQMNIPFNYWTVSLFLWIFEKTDNQNIHNHFELVKIYIDELLDKNNFIHDSSIKLSYDDLKSFLGDLAFTLYQHNSTGYKMTSDELTQYIFTYKNTHKKFVISAVDIVNLLLDRQILEKTKDLVTFRLNGVFEFFLAYKMQEDNEFKQNVLNDKSMILSFGNELEFYAGFQRTDFASIKSIFSTIKEILYPVTTKEDYENVDSQLDYKFTIDNIKESTTEKMLQIVNQLQEDETCEIHTTVDVPLDNSATVREKTVTDITTPIDTCRWEKALFILGRVFRNSNICDEATIADDILNYLLTGVCNLGFQYTDNINQISEEEDVKKLVNKINNIMPVLTAAFLYDAISQDNLIDVFKNKLDELYKNVENNEYRIFLLTLVLIDLDHKDFTYFDKSINLIRKKSLRFSILNKLLLLRFRHTDDRSFITKATYHLNNMASEFYKDPTRTLEGFDRIKNEKVLEEDSKRIRRNLDYKS